MKLIVIIAGIVLTVLLLQTNNSFANSDCKEMCCSTSTITAPAIHAVDIEPDYDPFTILIPGNHL
ncbi:MAG: hypothetical protein JST86_01445 [Bacteroidetes bacterium]|nr:hypothetical protein [Bacteroidota bacterium]